MDGLEAQSAGFSDFNHQDRRSGFDRRAAAQAAEQRAAAGPSAEEIARQVQAARQAGYQDGYRDGLVALDGFKQSYAQAMTAQVGALLDSVDAQLKALEGEIAGAVSRTATLLARHIVRTELAARPELVAKVAEEAVNAVLLSAQHIRVLVHPEDQALIAQGAAEALAARGARLMPAPDIQRGGCRIESDVGAIDARIETRWQQAAETLGQQVLAWNADEPATPSRA
jgi:flagellar assembly protein FliH